MKKWILQFVSAASEPPPLDITLCVVFDRVHAVGQSKKSDRKGLIVMDFHFISRAFLFLLFPSIINIIIISVSIWFSQRKMLRSNGRKGRATRSEPAKKQARTEESIKNETLLYQTYNLEKCLWIFLWNKLLLVHEFRRQHFSIQFFNFLFLCFHLDLILFSFFLLCYLSYKSHFER